jgi:hypothetical protein
MAPERLTSRMGRETPPVVELSPEERKLLEGLERQLASGLVMLQRVLGKQVPTRSERRAERWQPTELKQD